MIDKDKAKTCCIKRRVTIPMSKEEILSKLGSSDGESEIMREIGKGKPKEINEQVI